MDLAIQNANEKEIESNEIIRHHIRENQQLRAEYQHNLLSLENRMRSMLSDPVNIIIVINYIIMLYIFVF